MVAEGPLAVKARSRLIGQNSPCGNLRSLTRGVISSCDRATVGPRDARARTIEAMRSVRRGEHRRGNIGTNPPGGCGPEYAGLGARPWGPAAGTTGPRTQSLSESHAPKKTRVAYWPPIVVVTVLNLGGGGAFRSARRTSIFTVFFFASTQLSMFLVSSS